jgi:hypothetical protein
MKRVKSFKKADIKTHWFYIKVKQKIANIWNWKKFTQKE